MSFDPVELWHTMTPLAKGVAVLLIIMSVYSLTKAGRKELVREEGEWRRIAAAIMRVLDPSRGET